MTPFPGKSEGSIMPETSLIDVDDKQNNWLNKVYDILQADEVDDNENISWSAYFASLQMLFQDHLQSLPYCQCFMIMHTH